MIFLSKTCKPEIVEELFPDSIMVRPKSYWPQASVRRKHRFSHNIPLPFDHILQKILSILGSKNTYVLSFKKLVHVLCFIKCIFCSCVCMCTGFWQKVDVYQEQPDVHFKYALFVIMDTSRDGDYVAWSTYQNFNQLQMEHLRVPLVKVRLCWTKTYL